MARHWLLLAQLDPMQQGGLGTKASERLALCVAKLHHPLGSLRRYPPRPCKQAAKRATQWPSSS